MVRMSKPFAIMISVGLEIGRLGLMVVQGR